MGHIIKKTFPMHHSVKLLIVFTGLFALSSATIPALQNINSDSFTAAVNFAPAGSCNENPPLTCADGDCDDDGFLNPVEPYLGNDCNDANACVLGNCPPREIETTDTCRPRLTCGDGDCDNDGFLNPVEPFYGDDCDDGNSCVAGGCSARRSQPTPEPVATTQAPQPIPTPTPATVTPPPAAAGGGVSVTLTSNRTTVNFGETVILTWAASSNATSCRALAGAGFEVSNISGSDEVSALGGTSTFSIECSNGTSTTQAAKTVTVQNTAISTPEPTPTPRPPTPTPLPNDPVIRSFTADRPVVPAGQSTVLRWSATNATRCDAIAGPGFVTAGRVAAFDTVGPIRELTTFTIECINGESRVALDVDVGISTATPRPTTTVTATPVTVAPTPIPSGACNPNPPLTCADGDCDNDGVLNPVAPYFGNDCQDNNACVLGPQPGKDCSGRTITTPQATPVTPAPAPLETPVSTNGFVCLPALQTAVLDQPVGFTSGGPGTTGAFRWSAPEGTPSTGRDSDKFTTTYKSVGTYTVTATRGTDVATCRVIVIVRPQPGPPPSATIVSTKTTVQPGEKFEVRVSVFNNGNPVLVNDTYYFLRVYTRGAFENLNTEVPEKGFFVRAQEKRDETFILTAPDRGRSSFDLFFEVKESIYPYPAISGAGPVRITIGDGGNSTQLSHAECINNACVQVSGPGQNACTTNASCSSGGAGRAGLNAIGVQVVGGYNEEQLGFVLSVVNAFGKGIFNKLEDSISACRSGAGGCASPSGTIYLPSGEGRFREFFVHEMYHMRQYSDATFEEDGRRLYGEVGGDVEQLLADSSAGAIFKDGHKELLAYGGQMYWFSQSIAADRARSQRVKGFQGPLNQYNAIARVRGGQQISYDGIANTIRMAISDFLGHFQPEGAIAADEGLEIFEEGLANTGPTGPVADILSPSDGFNTSNQNATIQGRAFSDSTSPSPVTKVVIAKDTQIIEVPASLNSCGEGITINCYTWSAVITLTPGVNIVRVIAVDAAGKSSVSEDSIAITLNSILSQAGQVETGPGGSSLLYSTLISVIGTALYAVYTRTTSFKIRELQSHVQGEDSINLK